jgi:hypothetical protein
MNGLPQHMRPVRSHEGRDLHAVDDGIDARRGVGFGSHRVDAGICTAAFGKLLNPVVHILVHEIDGNGARLFRQIEALRNRVDGDHSFSTQKECASDGKLPHGTAAPDGDSLAALQIAEIGRHETCREDVAEKQHLIVRQSLGHLYRPHIGIRHAQIFSLAAGIATEQMRIAEEPGWGMAP